jgi:hypothetical protein
MFAPLILVRSSRKDVENFLGKDSVLRLLVYAENGRDYVAANHPPQKYKKKAMYFVKREACVLTPENIQEQVLYGDSSETPLESLSSITKHVFLPLLTCPDNQVGWPDFLTKELSESLHKFTANIFVAIGQMQGHTMLPLPAGVRHRQRHSPRILGIDVANAEKRTQAASRIERLMLQILTRWIPSILQRPKITTGFTSWSLVW